MKKKNTHTTLQNIVLIIILSTSYHSKNIFCSIIKITFERIKPMSMEIKKMIMSFPIFVGKSACIWALIKK